MVKKQSAERDPPGGGAVVWGRRAVGLEAGGGARADGGV